MVVQERFASVNGPAKLRGWSAWLSSIALTVLCFLGCAVAAPQLAFDPLPAYVFGFTAVVAATLAVSWFVPVRTDRRLACAIVLFAIVGLGALRAHGTHGDDTRAVAACVLVFLLAAGTQLGALVGGGIEDPGHLLFVALVSALADTFSVTQPEGPSAALAQSAEALSLLALPWPMLGSPVLAPLLGVGDVLFASLYLMASRVHGLAPRRTLGALAIGFLVTMLVVIVTELPVPALPFLGMAVLVAQPAARKVPLRDRKRGFLVMLGMLVAFAALILRRVL